MGNEIDSIIDAIKDSQALESNLTTDLFILSSRIPLATEDEMKHIREEIAQSRTARGALWAAVIDRSKIINTGNNSARDSLVAQISLLQITEDELARVRQQSSNIKDHNSTMSRMLQINTHYGSKFEAKTELLKLSIKVTVPLILVLLLKKFEFLSNSISNILFSIIISIGGIILIRAMWDIETRSEMNFDEYDWKYEDPSTHVPSIWEYNKKHFFNFDNPMKILAENMGICIGEGCCDNGMYYDNSIQKCVRGFISPKESFISGQLNGTELISGQDDEKIKGANDSSSVLSSASFYK